MNMKRTRTAINTARSMYEIKGDLDQRIDLEDEVKLNGWSETCKRLFIEKYNLDPTLWEFNIIPIKTDDELTHVECMAYQYNQSK